MPSPIYNRLHPNDKKRLKRLKFGLWIMIILFVSHGMFGMFPEIYPITRWGMYSFANGDPVELAEGYLFRWWIQVIDSDNNLHRVSDRQLAGQFRFNAASRDLILLNITQLAENANPESQQESADFLLNLIEQRYGENIQAFEVHRYAHLLDYARFPSVNEDTPDFIDVMVRVSGDGQSIEQVVERGSNDENRNSD
jgi:hypothetical protein